MNGFSTVLSMKSLKSIKALWAKKAHLKLFSLVWAFHAQNGQDKKLIAFVRVGCHKVETRRTTKKQAHIYIKIGKYGNATFLLFLLFSIFQVSSYFSFYFTKINIKLNIKINKMKKKIVFFSSFYSKFLCRQF